MRILEFLSSEEVNTIQQLSLEVLENVGVDIDEREALKTLKEAGAEVDYRSKHARIPSYLVKESLRSAPTDVDLCGRTREYDVKICDDGKVFFGSGANALYVLDPINEKIREATTEDCINLARLADAMENIHVYLTLVSPQDVPPTGVDRVRCAIAFKNTVKHFFHDAQGKEGAEDQIRMAAAVVGGIEELRKRPLLSLAPCITSPLRWGKDALEVLITMAKNKLPQIVSSEPMAGATSPVSLAGSLVLQNAEVLSGLVIAQLVNKGTPTLVCTLPTIMDMKTANIAMGSIEAGMMCAAMAQIMRSYPIPYVGTGGVADSKVADEQAGYEKAMTCLLPALAGTNLIHLSTGMLESLLTTSYEQVVIDNEIIGMVLRALRGISVNEETLAINIIKQVGPRGHFLNQKHTLNLLRKEHLIPKLTDRRTRKIWEKMGSKDILKRAKEEVDAILRTHQPEPLEKDIQREIDSIVKQALKGK